MYNLDVDLSKKVGNLDGDKATWRRNANIVRGRLSENDLDFLQLQGEKGPPVFRAARSELAKFRGPFLTSPLGANFVPQGLSCPPWVNLSPRGEVIPWG
jgi:hypothetical protein